MSKRGPVVEVSRTFLSIYLEKRHLEKSTVAIFWMKLGQVVNADV